MKMTSNINSKRFYRSVVYLIAVLIGVLLTTILINTFATNPNIPAHAKLCVTDSMINDVEGYVEETHHGTAHVERWNKVLAAFGENNGHTPMTAAEASNYSHWSRWTNIITALECLEGTQEQALNNIKNDIKGYVEETHYGTAHVERWNKVLATFGDDNGHTPMTAAEASNYSHWSRWTVVIEALKILEVQAAMEVQQSDNILNPQASQDQVVVNPNISWTNQDLTLNEGQNINTIIEIRVVGVNNVADVNGVSKHTVTGFSFPMSDMSVYTQDTSGYYIIPASSISVGEYSITAVSDNFNLLYKNNQTYFGSNAFETVTNGSNTHYSMRFRLNLTSDNNLVSGDRSVQLIINPGTYVKSGVTSTFDSDKTSLVITTTEDDKVSISADKYPLNSYVGYSYEWCYSANNNGFPTTFKDGSACNTGRFYYIAPVGIQSYNRGRIYPNNPTIREGGWVVTLPCVVPGLSLRPDIRHLTIADDGHDGMQIANANSMYFVNNLGSTPHYDPLSNRDVVVVDKDDTVCLETYYKRTIRTVKRPQRLNVSVSKALNVNYKIKFEIQGPTQDANKAVFKTYDNNNNVVLSTTTYSDEISAYSSSASFTIGNIHPYGRNNDDTVNTLTTGTAGSYTCSEDTKIRITVVDPSTLQPHSLARYFNISSSGLIDLCV